MYELMVRSDFAAAHRLNFFKTGCERLHGHNWKVEVSVRGEHLDSDGILIDFKLIKKALGEVLEQLDHRFLNELEPFRELSPSSENIAAYIFKLMASKINTDGVRVYKVTVWESEDACATFMMEERL